MTAAAPLAGCRIAVTRAAGKGAAFAEHLTALGAAVRDVPLTRIVDRGTDALREALAAQRPHDWLLLTSATAVARLGAVATGPDAQAAIRASRIAVVGTATERAAQEAGFEADVVPDAFRAERLLDALAARDDVAGRRVLYPAAAGARDVLPDGLRALGADVAVVHVYASEPDPDGPAALATALAAGAVDVVTLAAPSAVDALADAVPPERLTAVQAAVIGPVTARAAREAGFRVVAVAEPSTLDGLTRALVAWHASGQ